jgi:flagellar motor component MotA
MLNEKDIIERAMLFSEKARKDGLLALEGLLGEYLDRDIFEYGMRLVIDGTDYDFISKILDNIIAQETDLETVRLKKIQKEAVLMIQAGENPFLIRLMLNSYTGESLRSIEGFGKE